MGLAAVALALTTFARNREYRDPTSIWADTMMKCPESARAYNNFGVFLAGSGHLGQAAVCYREALRLKPDFADAYSNFGVVLARSGRVDEAIESFRQAIASPRTTPTPHAISTNAQGLIRSRLPWERGRDKYHPSLTDKNVCPLGAGLPRRSGWRAVGNARQRRSVGQGLHSRWAAAVAGRLDRPAERVGRPAQEASAMHSAAVAGRDGWPCTAAVCR